jgi:TPR repeat protein
MDIKKIIEKAILGDTEAQERLAWKYNIGEGIRKSYKKAFYWYKKSAKGGNPIVAYNIALCYLNGQGVGTDLKKAFYWMKQAAILGDTEAQERLAWMYDSGGGIRKSYKKAFYWYKKSAKGGNPIIAYNLSLCYLLGKGAETDIEKAFYWTKKAAQSGYIDAILALGWHYHNGFGTDKNLKLAKKYYLKCIDTDNSNSACYSLAQLVYDEEKDYKGAFKLFLKSASNGHLKSCYFLGRMYLEGKGVKQNIEEAKKYLKKAMLEIPQARRLLESKKFK